MTFFLTNWFYQLLQFIYKLFNNNYLPTIIVVTLLLRLIQIFPDIKNRKTQIKMQTVQPELNALQKKYANDPAKFRAEQSKLMKEHGISTWSSCLPMLLILPFFFCFLSAFRCWGNEESIMLMYQTAVSETAETEAERTAAAETAQKTFEHYKFLWVHNIWQPDCIIDSGEGGFLFRFDADVVTKPLSLRNINSKSLANMPMFKSGYTDINGNKVSPEELWSALCASGLAAGELGDAGSAQQGGCSSCTMDRSGMQLLPDSVDASIANIMLPEAAATEAPATEAPEATEAAATEAAATEAAEEQGSGVSGTMIYKSIMQRYPDSLSKNGKEPANGLLILPVLAAVMQLLTMLVSNKRNKQQSEQQKQMNAMMYVMPVISILVCMSSTTAFAFYWTISGAIQLISTIIINAVFDKKNKKNEAVSEVK